MNQLVQDLKFALRLLVRTPGLTAVALLSLAVGVGANTTIFSMINAVFLRGLPVERSEELVAVYGTDAQQEQQGAFMPMSNPNYEDYEERNEVFSSLARYAFTSVSLTSREGEPEILPAQLVSANYFQTLGVRPVLGRSFLPEEDEVAGEHRVAVLSYDTWRERFGGDPGIVGSSVTLNGQPFTVVGVAPDGFVGTFVLGNTALWAPAMTYPVLLPANLQSHFTARRSLVSFAFGRLEPGVTVEQAKASLEVIAESLQQEYPEENAGRSITVLPLDEAALPPQFRSNFVRAGGFLMAVVGLVLLIACANVANLLLSRALARRREIAVRLSMGATRGRLIRQFLSESLLLGLGGGVLGLLLAFWGRVALWALRPPFLAGFELDFNFDTRVLLFTFGIAVGTGLLFGIAPALQGTRPETVEDLKVGAGEGPARGSAVGIRHFLVAGQVALSLTAVVISAFFLRSLGNAMAIDFGFDTRQVAFMSLNLSAVGYDRATGEQYLDTVLDRVSTLPGIRSATLGVNIPLSFGGFRRTVLFEDRDPKAENNSILTSVDPVGEGYFRTLGIPLLQGRGFTAEDREGAPWVAVLNETAGRRFWPGEEALGKRFGFFGQDWSVEVVGIVADSKHNTLGEEPQPYIYLPRRQHFSPFITLFLAADGDPARALATAREEVRRLERAIPFSNVRTMASLVRQSMWATRMGAYLSGFMGLLALLMAVVGIYGVTSYSIRRRHREIGIRMALGAEVGSVVGLVVRQGMGLVVAGLAVGLLAAWFAIKAISSLLYGVSGANLLLFAVTAVGLALVALVATFIPARRAARVDPVRVLKSSA